jgi:hypothetical protein
MKPLPKNKTLLLQKKQKWTSFTPKAKPGKLLLQKAPGMREQVLRLRELVFGEMSGSFHTPEQGIVPTSTQQTPQAIAKENARKEGRRCRRKL